MNTEPKTILGNNLLFTDYTRRAGPDLGTTDASHEYLVDRAQKAFDDTKADRDALSPDELIRPNIELQGAVLVAFGTLKRITPYRPIIMSELPNFPIAVLDKLEDYTYSVEHALAITSVPRVSEDQLAAWTAELGVKRTTLLSDIDALTNRGFIEPGSTVNARGAKGIRNIAFDVRLFAEILLGVLPAAEGKTGATKEELIAAKELAMTALRVLGERPITSVTPADVELRARAFTVFSRAYDRVRRAMVYIRADAGDVDELMPSLYQGRGGSHRKEQPDAASSDAANAARPSAGASPAAVPSNVAPSSNATSPNGAPTNGASTHPPATAPGLPDAPPLVNQ